MPRARATAKRRRAILDAALECFTTFGFQGTTMEEVRNRANASTGSLYHHFESKEELAAALYADGIQQLQEGSLQALLRHRSAERGVRAAVAWKLRWVQDNPKMASYLFHHHHAGFLLPAEGTLDRLSPDLRSAIVDWISRQVEGGLLPALGVEMYWAILVGPAEFICRRRIREGKTDDIVSSSRDLEDAAWGALERILARQKADGRRRRPAKR